MISSAGLQKKQVKASTKVSGNPSTHPAIAHSLRMISTSLEIAKGCATVLVCGKISGRLLNPYATATSSMMSTSWKISGRVQGTVTAISSESEDTVGERDMRVRSLAIEVEGREREVQELI